MKRGGRCEKMLWKDKSFVANLHRLVFDEAHCIVQWGDSFRPQYGQVGNIIWQLPNIPIYLSSATLTQSMITDLKEKFRITDDFVLFQRSNDRPNIALAVQQMKHSQGSYEDLAFLVPKGWQEGDAAPKKFMVFFDSKREAEAASKFLQSRVSHALREKIPWFHAGMSKYFRVEEVDRFRDGSELWGFAATDSGGMVCSKK